MTKLKKTLSILTLIFLVLLACLILIEVFSILLIKKLGWNYEPAYLRIIKGYTSANLVGGRTEYHSWGSWNVPNYVGRIANNCFDVEYKFNSYGARDKERYLSGKNRTLVFGDSFIEGWGVDQDKILTANLERISGKEFLNFGISGSGTSVLNEFVLYRDFAREFEHESVMVGFYPGNDFEDNDPEVWGGLSEVYYRPFWRLINNKQDVEVVYFAEKVEGKYLPGLEPGNTEPHFRVYNSLKEFSAFLNLLTVLKNYRLHLTKQSAREFAYDLDVSDDAILATLIIYEKFAKLIGDKNKYLFVVPAASDVFYYLKTERSKIPKFEEFKKALTNQGWQVIDLIDVFADLPENEISEYFICDGHWSDKGNKLVAEYLYKVINK